MAALSSNPTVRPVSPPVAPCPLPAQALLARHAAQGAYTDAYTTELPQVVSLVAFVEAFYTGGVFRIERQLLAWFVRRPSTDADARAVAQGTRDAFSAWTVEARTADQLLMCDMAKRTRSWFMVQPGNTAGVTRLYFGSAVVPLRDKATGQQRMGMGFHALLGFHKLYSRVLLGAAGARLQRAQES